MSKENERDLTDLEYAVLGVISTAPQSGYSIINVFEEEDTYRRWSASPGSIYPMLKRLEKRGLLSGELEMVHETRPRKMYTLTPQGEAILTDWIKGPLHNMDVTEGRDVTLLKFMFAENRLTNQEIMDWLDRYQKAVEIYMEMLRLQIRPDAREWSTHQQLLFEATVMDLNTQRTWIEVARSRLLVQIPADE